MVDPNRNEILSRISAGSVTTYAGITCLAAFLLVALVFSITYFSTILIKNARGLFISAGVFLGYLVLGMVVKHHWPGTELPSLLLQPFATGPHPVDALLPHFGLQITIRAVIVLFFPFAAQWVLDRVDI
jgi:hypothetical protein